MINWYMNLNYPIQALIASLFTWGITSLGAAVVFLFKKVNKNVRVIVPTSKYKAYKKMLKKAGIGVKAQIYKMKNL